jgi:peptide/nickel transport system ATP-binding protein/oligopeptide transport system ATP-binding protein
VASPEARRERRILQGDVPSPIAPPPGCHLHTRCPFAADICRVDPPPLYEAGGNHRSACHFWATLPDPAAIVPSEGHPDPLLERLFGAFAGEQAGL